MSQPGLIKRFWRMLQGRSDEVDFVDPPLPAGIEETIGIKLNFTPRASAVLLVARKLARAQDWKTVKDVHLLYGLSQLGHGVAFQIVTGWGGDWNAIAERVRQIQDNTEISRSVSSCVPANEVISLANREREKYYHNFLGTEHILLGLLQAGGAAAEILSAPHSIEAIRRAILGELDPRFFEGDAMFVDEASINEPVVSEGCQFSAEAMRVLGQAEQEAITLKTPTIGALQLLAGVIMIDTRLADILQMRGVQLELVRAGVARYARPATSHESWSIKLYTLAAHDILLASHKESRGDLTGPVHILLAIIQSETPGLLRLFGNLGVDRKALRTELMRLSSFSAGSNGP